MSGAMDMAQLPDDVREKLAELELELSEGESDFRLNLNPIEVLVGRVWIHLIRPLSASLHERFIVIRKTA